MTSTHKFLGACIHCGMKVTVGLKQIGGNGLCTHDVQPIKRKVVYPTEIEIKWVNILNANESECEKHIQTMSDDLSELNQNQSLAEDNINEKFASLIKHVQIRQKQLLDEMNEAHAVRANAIEVAMVSLENHSQLNLEIKETADSTLCDEKQSTARQKKIVNSIAKVMKNTPSLRCIPTELRMEFITLQSLSNQISRMGSLKTKPVNAGKKCNFISCIKSSQWGKPVPRKIPVPIFLWKNLRGYCEPSGKFKFQFRVSTKPESNDNSNQTFDFNDDEEDQKSFDANSHMVVEYQCVEKMDDTAVTDEEWEHCTFQKTVPLSVCESVLAKQSVRYKLQADHIFKPNREVTIRLRLKFVSPDIKKYKSTIGEWIDEPLALQTPKCLEYATEFEGKSGNFMLSADESLNVTLQQFYVHFLKSIEYEVQENENVRLYAHALAPGQKPMLLQATSLLEQFTSDVFKIVGDVQRPEIVPKTFVPKRIFFVANYQGQNKKILLRGKDNDFNLNSVIEKIKAKFKIENSVVNITGIVLQNGEHLVNDEDVLKLYNSEQPKILVTCNLISDAN